MLQQDQQDESARSSEEFAKKLKRKWNQPDDVLLSGENELLPNQRRQSTMRALRVWCPFTCSGRPRYLFMRLRTLMILKKIWRMCKRKDRAIEVVARSNRYRIHWSAVKVKKGNGVVATGAKPKMLCWGWSEERYISRKEFVRPYERHPWCWARISMILRSLKSTSIWGRYPDLSGHL